jgi:hypothetical protein
MIDFYYFYFLKSICPILLIVGGISSNILILFIFSRKKFKINKSNNTFLVLAICDLLSSLFILIIRPDAFNLTFDLSFNIITCKLLSFMRFYLIANSNWSLVLVNLQRLADINKHFRLFNINKKFNFSVIIWNFIVFSPLLFYTKIKKIENETDQTFNSTNQSFESNGVCEIFEEKAYNVFKWLDLMNNCIIPFIIMILCSLTITFTIYKTKKKIKIKPTNRDIRFSTIILTLNILFFVLNLPASVYWFMGGDDYLIGYHIDVVFGLQFNMNFLIYITFYSKFRKEFFKIISFN